MATPAHAREILLSAKNRYSDYYETIATASASLVGIITMIATLALSLSTIANLPTYTYIDKWGNSRTQNVNSGHELALICATAFGAPTIGFIAGAVTFAAISWLGTRQVHELKQLQNALPSNNFSLTTPQISKIVRRIDNVGRKALMGHMNFSQLTATYETIGKKKFSKLIATCNSRRDINIWKDILTIPNTIKSPENLKHYLNSPTMAIEKIDHVILQALLALYKNDQEYEHVIFQSYLQRGIEPQESKQPLDITVGLLKTTVDNNILMQKASYFSAIPHFIEGKNNSLDLTKTAEELDISPEEMITIVKLLSGDKKIEIKQKHILALAKSKNLFVVDHTLSLFLRLYITAHVSEVPLDILISLVNEDPIIPLIDLLSQKLLTGNLSDITPEAIKMFETTPLAQQRLTLLLANNLKFYMKNHLQNTYELSSALPQLKEPVNDYIRNHQEETRRAWPILSRPKAIAQILYA